MSKAEEAVEKIAENLAAELSCEIADVEFVKEASEWFLRVFVDREGGVDLDFCEVFSRRLSEILDENDPISQAYRLEVSSPGIERPLKKEKDFVRFSGEKIKVSLFEAIDSQKQLIGTLLGCEDSKIGLETDKETYNIDLKNISKANLYWEF